MIFNTCDQPMYYMRWCCITSFANTCITCVVNVLHVLVLHYKCVTADHEPVQYKGSHVWHGADSCIAKSCISNMRLQLVRSNQARTNCLTKHGLILIIALQSMPAAPKKPLRAECQDAIPTAYSSCCRCTTHCPASRADNPLLSRQHLSAARLLVIHVHKRCIFYTTDVNTTDVM